MSLLLAGCGPLLTWGPTALHRDSNGELFLVIYTCGFDLNYVDVGNEDDDRSVYARIDASSSSLEQPVVIPLDRLGADFPVSPAGSTIDTNGSPLYFRIQSSTGTMGRQFFERIPATGQYTYRFDDYDSFVSGSFEEFSAAALEYCSTFEN